MTASVWQPGSGAIAVNAENASLIQKFIATAGQTVFNLTQFTYVVGTGSIRVYRNGVKLAVSEVTELSTTRFSLTVANLLVGEVIECSAVLGSQDAVTAAAISAASSAAEAAASAASVNPDLLLHKTNNLADVASPAAALANLGGAPLASPEFTGEAKVPQVTLRTVKLGDNADTSKNFLLTTPVIADGTLTVQRESGEVVASINAVGNVVFPGNAQTWQNVKTTPGRATGTTYTNDTGQPITVSIVAQNAVAAGYTTLNGYVDGVIVTSHSVGTVYMAELVPMTFIVPAGATYKITLSGNNTPSTSVWMELR